MNLLDYLLPFLLALGILIVVHEFGHYLVARLCGVKVLRFSLGFGRPLLVRKAGADQTEWVLSVFPLGGYVKMLDEREAPVAAHELHRAFNRQSVWRRIAIVAAGPLANFLLAIVLYWGLYTGGVEELRPRLAEPEAATAARDAGFQGGELVRSVNGEPVETWQEFRWKLLNLALDKQVVTIETINASREIGFRKLDLAGVVVDQVERDITAQLGLSLLRPRLPAVLGRLSEGGPAESAGLRAGDRVVRIGDSEIESWSDLVAIVRDAPGRALEFQVLRGGRDERFQVVPSAVDENGRSIGRIGAALAEADDQREQMFVTVRYGVGEALSKSLGQTWDTSAMSVSMMGRMIVGEVSVKNLSGPVTIADFAGQSARMGWAYYIKFLALISISLGVLNLMPVPVLDGGHLLYYVIEIIKGGPVSERAMEIGQQIGMALLAALMAFAFYNDINRLFAS
ncbi:RIP metalloprotease RseP [Thauera aminoaromatica]|uniref:Zinc metalloprotease n=1 Tax=Thauera aminoaromatica TaxID=164330 RepID=A0A5C7S6T5_THASP|nr:RIP metalloprotease RseP [Thauera aminoaromatica]TXH79397.1 MAG: RIP metalloprotease RseP [Thauera aminoaromatica]